MSSLFDLAGEYKELYAMLTDADEDEQQVVEDTLEAVIGEIEVKAEGYVCLLNRLDMELSACKKHRDEWARAYTVRENAIKRLKQRAADAMMQMGKKEIKAGDNVIKLKGNGGTAPLILDENKEVPQSYMKVILEPDKEKIRKAIEGGAELDFAHIAPRGKHIEIK